MDGEGLRSEVFDDRDRHLEPPRSSPTAPGGSRSRSIPPAAGSRCSAEGVYPVELIAQDAAGRAGRDARHPPIVPPEAGDDAPSLGVAVVAEVGAPPALQPDGTVVLSPHRRRRHGRGRGRPDRSARRCRSASPPGPRRSTRSWRHPSPATPSSSTRCAERRRAHRARAPLRGGQPGRAGSPRGCSTSSACRLSKGGPSSPTRSAQNPVGDRGSMSPPAWARRAWPPWPASASTRSSSPTTRSRRSSRASSATRSPSPSC